MLVLYNFVEKLYFISITSFSVEGMCKISNFEPYNQLENLVY